MPPAQPLSRDVRIYLALWRKAFREKDLDLPPVSVKVSSYSMALTVRGGLYRAIKPYRYGNLLDEELQQAADLFVVSTPKEAKSSAQHTVSLTPRRSLIELERELEALGLSAEDLLTPEELIAKTSLTKLLEEPADEPIQPLNPFYTRERD